MGYIDKRYGVMICQQFHPQRSVSESTDIAVIGEAITKTDYGAIPQGNTNWAEK
jgi:hypothetical protein